MVVVKGQGLVEGWGMVPSSGEGVLGWILQIILCVKLSESPHKGPLETEIKVTLQ